MGAKMTLYTRPDGTKVCFGHEPSAEALKCGYLDYHTLAQIVGNRIMNNSIINCGSEFEPVNGSWLTDDEEMREVFQWYMVDSYGVAILQTYTTELVVYSEELDVALWGITHWGTSWDYVMTDIKLVEEEENG